MSKHKRGRNREQDYMQSPMFNPNMMHPNMMNPNMNMGHNPNMMGNMNPNMGGSMNPNMGGNMNPNMGGNMNPGMGGNMDPNMGGNMNPNMGGMGNQSGNPLMNMLNGVDINQISSLLGAFGMGNNSKKQYSEENNRDEFTGSFGGEAPITSDDDVTHFLGAIKPFLPPNKVKVIDKIIDMYISGELED